ncbi:MAG: M48 family metallopeptidase [Selenomonadaceae bacterium]
MAKPIEISNNILAKYVHPQERAITDRLYDNLVSEEYCNQLLENYKLFTLENELPDYMGKCLEVNTYQMPKIYDIIRELSEKISMTAPTAYVYESYYFNTSAEGCEEPWIQISTKTLENFDEDELRFVIARELAHIKLGHMKWEVLTEEFAKNIDIAKEFITIPAYPAASRQMFEIYADRFKLISANWKRVSEYTADRCALALCDFDIKTAISAILKQILNSKLLQKSTNISSFMRQTENIMSFTTNAAKFTRMDEDFPYGPFRLKELISFASIYGAQS